MGNRPPVIMTFFGASLALGSVLELLLRSTTELVIASCHIKSTFCRTSHSDGETAGCCYIQLEKTTLQNDDFFFFLVCSGGTHLLSFFKCRVTVKWLASEFFGNFSHRCSRSAGATALHRPMPPSHGPATALLTLKALVFFAKLEPTLHCTFISSS